ncbi:MAG: Na+/H+ antiporter subunit E [Egibacteraceae bacterium]
MRRPVSSHRLLPIAWLTLVWVALWGELTPANLLGGVAVAVTVSTVFAAAGPRRAGPVRSLAALRFAGWFAAALVRATFQVAVETVRPTPRLAEGIVAVRLEGASDALATLVANTISLTPGTLTVDADSDAGGATLYVHGLQLFDVDGTRAELQHLGRLAAAAFGEPVAEEVQP